ncbi:MAG: helix-turn-helix transcriptional regulator [Geobacteraceae bacterium]|nr:helix-turn-helix transcriptional regulator [Geobacteraceae bacterium]
MVTKEDIDNRIRYNLTRLRMEAGLSQDDLARWSGVKHVSRVEAGTVSVSKNTVARLANALDVDISEFYQPEESFLNKLDALSTLSKLFRECTPKGQRLVLRFVSSFQEYEKGINFLSKKSIQT